MSDRLESIKILTEQPEDGNHSSTNNCTTTTSAVVGIRVISITIMHCEQKVKLTRRWSDVLDVMLLQSSRHFYCTDCSDFFCVCS
jgi:hypothetical protein